MARVGEVERKTKETYVRVRWALDEAGDPAVATGIGFFDHMLEALGKHSATALRIECRGDLHIDGHHTTEDTGIVCGQALREALEDRAGVERFGHMVVPLDEALVAATVDLSGRPHCEYDLHIPAPHIGTWDRELVCEFFAAFADNARCCIHLHQLHGRNSHHIVEAAFKAFARALRQAIAVTGSGVPSTKGVLA